jgi:predicted DsbA family dithiol-disulfide isomerase
MLRRMDPKKVEAAQIRLKRIGAAVGLNLKFGGYIGSSRRAHQLLYMAGRRKGIEMQSKVAEMLFHYQFEREADISELDTLVEAGVQAGLCEEDVRKWLESDVGMSETEDEARRAKATGIQGVPHFIIGGQHHLDGAVETSEFFETFVEVREGR